ncbi:MAG: YbhB/YbcL family Raf kinase inhibitor-like protein [Blautia sp.]
MKKLIVSSPCFEDGGLIPVKYTGHGEDVSPELVLDDLSEMAESIAIIMDDMGHPIPAYNHWVIWNIPAISLIPENIPHGEQVDSLGAIQGCGYGKHRYRGPKPPFNWSHIYHFNVFSLDCRLDLPSTARKKRFAGGYARPYFAKISIGRSLSLKIIYNWRNKQCKIFLKH